jgi:ankyrin repeat protein
MDPLDPLATLYTRCSDLFYHLVLLLPHKDYLNLSRVDHTRYNILYHGCYRNMWSLLWQRDLSHHVPPIHDVSQLRQEYIMTQRNILVDSYHMYRYGLEKVIDKFHSLSVIGVKQAVIFNQIHLVEYLLNRGIDLHWNNDKALRLAVKHNHDDLVHLLVDRGADIFVKDNVVLYSAAHNCNWDLVQYFVNKGIPVGDRYNAVLRFAVRDADLDIIKLLVNAGASIDDSVPYNDHDSRYVACESGKSDIVAYFISLSPDDLYWRRDGLALAISCNFMPIVEMLTSLGGTDYYRALSTAAQHNYENMINYFLTSHHYTDSELVELLLMWNNYQIGDCLVERGYCFSQLPEVKLIHLCSSSNLKMIEFLFAHGLGIQSEAPLMQIIIVINNMHNLVRARSYDVLKLLIQRGSPIDTTYKDLCLLYLSDQDRMGPVFDIIFDRDLSDEVIIMIYLCLVIGGINRHNDKLHERLAKLPPNMLAAFVVVGVIGITMKASLLR